MDSFKNTQEDKIDIYDLERYRVRPDDEYTPPTRMLAQEVDGKTYTIGTLGNISMVVGAPKSRKSFVVNMMIVTSQKDNLYQGQFKCEAPEDKRGVLYIDTEQSKDHVLKAVKRVCKQLGTQTPNVETLALRTLNPKDRLLVTESAIEQLEGIGLVVIDGIADLITSINDEEQATNLTSTLMRLSEEKKIHIMCVLHTNKTNGQARGHVGTYFQNKAETTLDVSIDSTDEDVSTVKARYSRDEAFKPFAIRVLENIPVVDEHFVSGKKLKSIKRTDISDEMLNQILSRIFAGNISVKSNELLDDFVVNYEEVMGQSIGKSNAKEIIAKAKMDGVIYKENGRHFDPFKLKILSPLG